MSQFKFLGDIAGQYGNSYIPLVEGRMRVTGDEGLSISDAKEIARKAAAMATAASMAVPPSRRTRSPASLAR